MRKNSKNKLELSKVEKQKLIKFFDSNSFRKYVDYIIRDNPNRIKNSELFTLIKNQLCYICAFTFFTQKYYGGFYTKNDDELYERLEKDSSSIKHIESLTEGLIYIGSSLIIKLMCLDTDTANTLFYYFAKIAIMVEEQVGYMNKK